MRLFDPLFIAISTYTVLPAPRVDWSRENMRYSICCLPAAGLLPGGALLLWNLLCTRLGAPALLFAPVAAALPILLTGGIHMDGYMDTVDALSSHREREKKLEILKDSHVGAFAVLYAGVFLLLSTAFFAACYQSGALPALAAGYVLSRTLAALCAVTLKSARGDGMLAAFTVHAEKRAATAAMLVLAVLCAAGMTALHPVYGIAASAVSAAWFFLYRRLVRKEFGGATGDTTGFFLTVTELLLLLAAAGAALC